MTLYILYNRLSFESPWVRRSGWSHLQVDYTLDTKNVSSRCYDTILSLMKDSELQVCGISDTEISVTHTEVSLHTDQKSHRIGSTTKHCFPMLFILVKLYEKSIVYLKKDYHDMRN